MHCGQWDFIGKTARVTHIFCLKYEGRVIESYCAEWRLLIHFGILYKHIHLLNQSLLDGRHQCSLLVGSAAQVKTIYSLVSLRAILWRLDCYAHGHGWFHFLRLSLLWGGWAAWAFTLIFHSGVVKCLNSTIFYYNDVSKFYSIVIGCSNRKWQWRNPWNYIYAYITYIIFF